MSGRGPPARAAGAAAPRHIRSVAEHFLGEERPGPDAPAPAAVTTAAGSIFRFVVAGCSHGLLPAWAAAGLAQTAVPRAGGPRLLIELVERHDEPWSALPFLGGGDSARLRRLLAAEAGAAAACGGPWLVQRDTVRPSSFTPPPPDAIVVRWLNLGCVDDASLAIWESAAREAGRPPASGGVGDGLVWCLLCEEAGRLSPAYLLGRLSCLLTPAQLKVLVFPSGWRLAPGAPARSPRADTGAAPLAGGGASPEPDAADRMTAALERCKELLAVVAPPGCATEVLAVTLAPGRAVGGVHPGSPGPAGRDGDARRRLFAPIVASLEMGAAARRRPGVHAAAMAGQAAS